MGLSLHNSIAVIQGYRGKKSSFIRTPKYGIKNIKDSFKKGFYLDTKISGITIFEGLLSILFAASTVYGIVAENYNFVIFHLLLSVGYGATFFYSLKHFSK
jgi:hypothetical protein